MTTPVYLIKRKRKLPSGKKSATWMLRWFGTDGKPQHESLGSCDKVTRKDAEDSRREKELKIGSGKIRRDKPRKLTLAEWFAMDRQSIASDVRGSTLIEYDLAANKAVAALGDTFTLCDLGWPEVGKIKQRMTDPPQPIQADGAKPKKQRKPASAATVRKTLGTLRASWNRAHKQGFVNSNPFAEQGLPKVESKVQRIFTRAEVDAMVKIAPDVWWQTFIQLAATTGMRLNELLNLTWADIDMDKATVTVQRKAAGSFQAGERTLQTWEWSAKAKSSYRTIPLAQDAIEQLKKQRMRMGASPFVFLDAQRIAALQHRIKNGKLPAKAELANNMIRQFRQIQTSAAAGGEWRIGCLHDLRRTYCTWMADVVPMHVLRQWAGHSDITTTATFYLGMSDGMADRARKALAAAG